MKHNLVKSYSVKKVTNFECLQEGYSQKGSGFDNHQATGINKSITENIHLTDTPAGTKILQHMSIQNKNVLIKHCSKIVYY